MTITIAWQAANAAQQLDLVQAALHQDVPINPAELIVVRELNGQMAARKPPRGAIPRQAAVLLLLYPHEDQLWLPLTVRSHQLAKHRGEVSLPGGAADPDDADLVATALRETEEELGIDPQRVTVLGSLTPFYIPASNYELLPVVGYLPHLPPLRPNPAEIAEVLPISLATLADRSIVQQEIWILRDRQMRVEFFWLHRHKVWGATALLLSEMVARIRAVAEG